MPFSFIITNALPRAQASASQMSALCITKHRKCEMCKERLRIKGRDNAPPVQNCSKGTELSRVKIEMSVHGEERAAKLLKVQKMSRVTTKRSVHGKKGLQN